MGLACPNPNYKEMNPIAHFKPRDNVKDVVCFICKKKGHLSKECPNKDQQARRATSGMVEEVKEGFVVESQ